MATATRRRKTLDDYMKLPSEVRAELIERDLYMSPSLEAKHQQAVLNLAVALRSFVRNGKLGEVFVAPFDCILSQTDVVHPDVLFVAAANLGKIHKRLHGAPGPRRGGRLPRERRA